MIDGKYVAFIRYATDYLVLGSQASTAGNVITILPEVLADSQAEAFLKEHEAQHVIQHHEIENSDVEYSNNRLKYEKEACARQIIRGTVVREQFRATVIDNLEYYGMQKRYAEDWVRGVFKSRQYPGVNLPRR